MSTPNQPTLPPLPVHRTAPTHLSQSRCSQAVQDLLEKYESEVKCRRLKGHAGSVGIYVAHTPPRDPNYLGPDDVTYPLVAFGHSWSDCLQALYDNIYETERYAYDCALAELNGTAITQIAPPDTQDLHSSSPAPGI